MSSKLLWQKSIFIMCLCCIKYVNTSLVKEAKDYVPSSLLAMEGTWIKIHKLCVTRSCWRKCLSSFWSWSWTPWTYLKNYIMIIIKIKKVWSKRNNEPGCVIIVVALHRNRNADSYDTTVRVSYTQQCRIKSSWSLWTFRILVLFLHMQSSGLWLIL